MYAKSAEEVIFVHMVYEKVDAKSEEEVVFVNMVDKEVYAKSAEEVVFVNMGWHQLRPGHPDSVAGQLRQSLLIGFILALAIKGLVDPDCLVLPAPVAPGFQSDPLVPLPPLVGARA